MRLKHPLPIPSQGPSSTQVPFNDLRRAGTKTSVTWEGSRQRQAECFIGRPHMRFWLQCPFWTRSSGSRRWRLSPPQSIGWMCPHDAENEPLTPSCLSWQGRSKPLRYFRVTEAGVVHESSRPRPRVLSRCVFYMSPHLTLIRSLWCRHSSCSNTTAKELEADTHRATLSPACL